MLGVHYKKNKPESLERMLNYWPIFIFEKYFQVPQLLLWFLF